MTMNHVMSYVLFLALGNMIPIIYILWRRKKHPIAVNLGMVFIASTIYLLGCAHEIANANLLRVIFWTKVEYIGIPFISSLWFILVLKYLNIEIAYTKRFFIAMNIVPMIILFLNLSNDQHHLLFRKIYFVKTSTFPTLFIEYGWWHYIHVFYSNFFIVLSILFIILAIVKKKNEAISKYWILLVAVLIPWIMNIFSVVYSYKTNLDFSPLGLAIAGDILVWSVYKYDFIPFTPLDLKSVFETMTEGALVIDKYGNIINFNKAMSNIVPELQATKSDLVKFKNCFANYREVINLVEQEGVLEKDLCIQNDNEYRYYNIKCSTFYSNEIALGKIIIMTDISEMKERQTMFTFASAQLNMVMTIKNKLLYLMDNKIKDPLHNSIRIADHLLQSELERKNTDLALELHKNISKTMFYTNSILNCLSDKTSKPIYFPKELNLYSVIQNTLKEIEAVSNRKNIGIHLMIDLNFEVYFDKEMLCNVLKNLIVNAIKFSCKNSNIDISAKEENRMIVVEVKDYGIGIDAEKVQILFQDDSLEPTIGTEGEIGVGLGLQMCRYILKRSGGDIWLESTFGEGSSVYISLPKSIR